MAILVAGCRPMIVVPGARPLGPCPGRGLRFARAMLSDPSRLSPTVIVRVISVEQARGNTSLFSCGLALHRGWHFDILVVKVAGLVLVL